MSQHTPSYWSRIETMERADIEMVQLRRLNSLLSYVRQRSLFYTDRLSSLPPDGIRSLAEMERLPFTNKKDIVEAPAPTESGGTGLFCGDPSSILRWHRTSGTTGKPVKIADTAEDWDAYGELSAEALYAMGARKGDTVVAAFGYGPFIAFWGYIAGIERIGATFVASGNMDSTARIELMKEFGATVLMSTPSYSIHLGETARAAGIDLARETKIRLLVHTGEPSTPLIKRKVEMLWGAAQRDRFGTTETGGFAYECPQSPGTYHIQEGYVIPEVLDAVTSRPVAADGVGELVLTPLFRRGMPLVRFRTGNLVRLLPDRRCACGRTFRSLEETENGVVIRRLDKLLKVKGVLVDPIAIENTIRAFEHFGEEYRIIFDKGGDMGEVRVQVELRTGLSPEELESERTVLMENMKRRIMVRVGVELLPFGSLERFEEKGRRIVVKE